MTLQAALQCRGDRSATICAEDASWYQQRPSQSPPSGCCHQNIGKFLTAGAHKSLDGNNFHLIFVISPSHSTKTLQTLQWRTCLSVL